MLDWIHNNTSWLFDGIGVAALTVVGGFVLRWFRRKKQDAAPITQTQRGGIASTNVQIGSISINEKERP